MKPIKKRYKPTIVCDKCHKSIGKIKPNYKKVGELADYVLRGGGVRKGRILEAEQNRIRLLVCIGGKTGCQRLTKQ